MEYYSKAISTVLPTTVKISQHLSPKSIYFDNLVYIDSSPNQFLTPRNKRTKKKGYKHVKIKYSYDIIYFLYIVKHSERRRLFQKLISFSRITFDQRIQKPVGQFSHFTRSPRILIDKNNLLPYKLRVRVKMEKWSKLLKYAFNTARVVRICTCSSSSIFSSRRLPTNVGCIFEEISAFVFTSKYQKRAEVGQIYDSRFIGCQKNLGTNESESHDLFFSSFKKNRSIFPFLRASKNNH